jgi:hypothetical protein
MTTAGSEAQATNPLNTAPRAIPHAGRRCPAPDCAALLLPESSLGAERAQLTR